MKRSIVSARRQAAGRSARTAGPAACTIVSRNYLSHARILAQSFKQHVPNGRFYLLIVDKLPEGVALDKSIRLIAPEELGFSSYPEMCFKYDVTELSTAVKPAL